MADAQAMVGRRPTQQERDELRGREMIVESTVTDIHLAIQSSGYVEMSEFFFLGYY
jgi:hypothetical protein